MKIKSIYTILLIVCTIPLANAQWGKKIKGSGNLITKNINTSDYDIIDTKGSMDVILEIGTEGAIRVIADDNIIDLISISTEGAVLKIVMKEKVNYYSKNGIKVYVPFTDLNEILLKGSGDLISKSPIVTNSFSCTLVGSGDLETEIKAETVVAYMKGSGDIDLSGSTNLLSVEMTGSGDFNAFNLKSQSTDVSLKGSGDIEVNAQKSIKARLLGSGDITYSGNPYTKDVNVKGSGDIDSRN